MSEGKQFIIKPGTCVDEMLEGVNSTFPGLSINTKSRIILHDKSSTGNNRMVGLVTGGGSGHEPFASGFVGEGMLTCAVAGSLFSSPPPSHILSAICNSADISTGGVLVLILNYTGDVLNFGLAVERAKCKGYNVKSITIDEDCAIDIPEGAGKRGLSGCLFMFKIAGGLANMRKSLDEIYHECVLIKKNIATLGVTIKPCSMPGIGPLFEIEEGFMEVGVGIHGEAGALKMKLVLADEVVKIILDKLCKTLLVQRGDRVCTIVNNLGGSSQLEMFLVAGEVVKQLREKGVEVVRQYVGSLMTSLDMAGVQVSMLLLPTERTLWLDCLDAPTTAFAWPGNSLSLPNHHKREIIIEKESNTKLTGVPVTDAEATSFKKCLQAASAAIKKNAQRLNELDKGCGDGDTGSTLRRMADAVLEKLEVIPVKYPGQSFSMLSELAEEVMGGTSGALYSLMFVGASGHSNDWVATTQSAVRMMMTYSKARVGSRTMFDVLIPACESFKEEMCHSGNWMEAMNKAIIAADTGCQQTLHYKPLYGRASYVGANNLTDVDAGAFGVTVWLHAIQSSLTQAL